MIMRFMSCAIQITARLLEVVAMPSARSEKFLICYEPLSRNNGANSGPTPKRRGKAREAFPKIME